MLVAPKALAVTVTGPLAPGAQVVKATSQCPAQATPFGAKLRMEVSLEAKVMVVLRVVPDAVWALAEKPRVPPSTRDVAEPGVRLMCPGNNGGPGWDPPPHPVMAEIERKATARRRLSEQNRPMHSSLLLFIAYDSQPSPHACKGAQDLPK